MAVLEVDKKLIIKICEIILDKYPFIDEKNKRDIYRLIGSSEEIESIKAQIENDKEI